MGNGPKRPKVVSIQLHGFNLTKLQEFAKLANVTLESYVITAAMSYPQVLVEINNINKLAREAGLFDETPNAGEQSGTQTTIPTGTSEAQPSQEG